MEKLGGSFGQSSSHLGPEGYGAVPPKDEVCHQEAPVLWLGEGCLNGCLLQVTHAAAVGCRELRASARPLFALGCRKAGGTTYAYSENRNKMDSYEETPEVGPCDLRPQKTVLGYGTCCTS